MKGKSKQTFVDIMSSTRTSFSGYTPLYLPNGTTLTNVVTTGRVRSAEDIWLEVYNSANIELFSTNETQNAHSGHIHIETDDAAGGFQAGGIEIKMGDNLGPEDAGGKRIRLEAGDGSGGGAGADIVLECGASTGTGNGGGVIVEAGNAGSAEANTSRGGDIVMVTGDANGGGDGGDFVVFTGQGNTSGGFEFETQGSDAGSGGFSVTTGPASSGGGQAGKISLTAGIAATGTDGTFEVTVGGITFVWPTTGANIGDSLKVAAGSTATNKILEFAP